jgi:hypothetical protein
MGPLPEEQILGEIPLLARLSIGSEKLRLFATTNGMIVAHVGKRGVGALATTSFFGRLSGAVEDLFKSGREFKGNKELGNLVPEAILAADKDNFFISYNEVVSVEVTGSSGLTRVTVLTREDKFKFSTVSSGEKVVRLLRGPLGGKLKYTVG